MTDQNEMPLNDPRVDVPEPVDEEWALWIDEHMPQGDDLTAAELRADYLLEKVNEAEAEVARLDDFTARRVALIREHADVERGKLERRIGWLASKVRGLVPMTADEFKATYGKKSLNLPHGKLGFRAVRATVEIHDPVKALAFAKANGLDVSVTEKVGKKPLIAYVTETGDVPGEDAGIEWVDGYDAFYHKATGGV